MSRQQHASPGTSPATAPQLVASQEQLDALTQRLASSEWLAVDTEFRREDTYRPELCLIQLATAQEVACVDPLALPSIEPLLDLLYEPRVTKVFHAAGQDLEILHAMRGQVPANLFDTQLAAPLLGFPEQVGYGELVQQLLGVRLTKAHTRADWTRRPLPAQQLRYAADDVIYLAQLYPLVRDRLLQLGRLDWLRDDLDALTDAQRFTRPDDEMWRAVRGTRRLRGPALSIARALAAWREQSARQRNLPRGWVLKDAVLLELAKQAPRQVDELRHIAGLSRALIRRDGERLVRLIRAAETAPPPAQEQRERKPRLTVHQEATVDLLAAVARLHAAEHGIHHTVLAPRKALEALVRGEAQGPLSRGWRHQLLGRQLDQILTGHSAVRVAQGQLRIEPQ